MLAERSVRRLSIRAPDDALARRAGFLIEDALRTASLPGDGAGLLLVRRLRLAAFPAGATPQLVALRLEAACREAPVLDGTAMDDAALASAPAVRFADGLAAHLALTRLIFAGAPRRAWCWPLVVKAYRPALGSGAALRAVALSLAALPEAPAALPHWTAQLVARGEAACAALLLALDGDDTAVLERACRGARSRATPAVWSHWQAALAWSVGRLGAEDVRHLWLRDMAWACGVENQRWSVSPPAACEAALPQSSGTAASARRAIPGAPAEAQADQGHDAGSPARSPDGIAVSGNERSSRPSSVTEAGESRRTGATDAASGQREAAPPAPAPHAAQGGDLRVSSDSAVAGPGLATATAGGGLLFLVPLLARLGLPEELTEGRAQTDLPQRIFATLLRRLPIAEDDPAWLLCDLPLVRDRGANREAARWLGACRRELRCRVRIGLHSLVCRPATIAITPTHVDVQLPIDAIDLRIRRAGLDIDPGWVSWLGWVLRFHYGRDDQ